MGHGPHSFKNFCVVLCIVRFVRSVYCLYVNVYCTTATGWLPNCSLTNISTQFTLFVYVPTVVHSNMCSTCPVQRPLIFYYFKHLAPRTCWMTILCVCLYKNKKKKYYDCCHPKNLVNVTELAELL